ncbi:MAG: GNAT family N-acetyltransferase [Paludibacteraceae bacterium]|nr:GNAT family N-acetyltransferase [Paludibacteraceae bacterium]
MMTPFAVGVSRSSGSMACIAVGYITKERNHLKQCFTRRAIIIGGPMLSDDITDAELSELLLTLRRKLSHRAIYIETRNFNDYSRWRKVFEQCGFAYQPHLNFHIDTSSIDIVEQNLGKSRKRDIRTSFRDGVTIIEQPTREQLAVWYDILKRLYTTKIHTPLFPLAFFERLFESDDGRLLLVELNGEIIGGTACVALEGKCLYEWFVCGRDGEWKSVFPSSVATYAGICYAARNDMPRFDMMGAGTPDEAYGVRDFKSRFGGKEVEHGRFLYVAQPLLYKIGKLGVKWLKR